MIYRGFFSFSMCEWLYLTTYNTGQGKNIYLLYISFFIIIIIIISLETKQVVYNILQKIS